MLRKLLLSAETIRGAARPTTSAAAAVPTAKLIGAPAPRARSQLAGAAAPAAASTNSIAMTAEKWRPGTLKLELASTRIVTAANPVVASVTAARPRGAIHASERIPTALATSTGLGTFARSVYHSSVGELVCVLTAAVVLRSEYSGSPNRAHSSAIHTTSGASATARSGATVRGPRGRPARHHSSAAYASRNAHPSGRVKPASTSIAHAGVRRRSSSNISASSTNVANGRLL